MSLFGKMLGLDQFKVQQNALLANNLYEGKMPEGVRKHIIFAVFMKALETGSCGGTVESILSYFSGLPRGIQMQWLTKACLANNIPSGMHRHVFSPIRNPMDYELYLEDHMIRHASDVIHHHTGVRLFWPGNSVRVDFKTIVNLMLEEQESKSRAA